MDYIVEGSIVYDLDGNEYEVQESIGSGGFGIVFKIKRKKDNKIFALKSLQVGFSQKEYLDSFRHEAEAATQISNENVLKYSFFHNGDDFKELPPYIIMEFANKGNLASFLKDQKPKGFLSNETLNSIFQELINGTKAINDKIIHRDLKPANILISNGKFKITDFGLSKISEDNTRTSTFKGSGTYSYMSPEAWRLEKNSLLMDIYSMGLIFYEIATLQHPFFEETINNINDWRDVHLYKSPKKPRDINSDLSPILEQLILKMIAKSTTDRFKSWESIKEYLKKESLPPTGNSERIAEILSKKAKIDGEKTKKQLEVQRRDREKEAKRKLVQHVFNEKILQPLERFVDELNEKLPLLRDKIIFHTINHKLFLELTMGNRNNVSVMCEVIFKEDFYRAVTQQGISGFINKRGLQLPKLRGRNVLAWGIVKSSSGKGYNFVLLEKENDPYGELVLLTNTNNALNRNRRRSSEPFYFEFNELEKQLSFINALHIYDIKDEPFSIDKVYSLISEELLS